MKDEFLKGIKGLKQIWHSMNIIKQGNIISSDHDKFSMRTKQFLDRQGYLRWYNRL